MSKSSWAIALAAAALLGAMGNAIDSLTGSDEMEVSTALLDAQRQSQMLMQREQAGVTFCRAAIGESLPVWDEDGRLAACQPKRGKMVTL